MGLPTRCADGGWVCLYNVCEKDSRGRIKLFITNVNKARTILVSEGSMLLSALSVYLGLFWRGICGREFRVRGVNKTLDFIMMMISFICSFRNKNESLKRGGVGGVP
jgi:hypothetical protein